MLGGTGALRHGPDIPVRATRRDAIVRPVAIARAIRVVRAFRILVVEHPVRMDGGRKLRVVSENDDDRVPDFRADQRTQEAEMLPFSGPRRERLEGVVRVLAIERLLRLPACDGGRGRMLNT